MQRIPSGATLTNQGVSTMNVNSTLSRVLTGFATLALAYGAYSAFTEKKLGLAVLLALATLAAAIPTFVGTGK